MSDDHALRDARVVVRDEAVGQHGGGPFAPARRRPRRGQRIEVVIPERDVPRRKPRQPGPQGGDPGGSALRGPFARQRVTRQGGEGQLGVHLDHPAVHIPAPVAGLSRGGLGNVAAGDYSFVAGQSARNTDATHDGVFLFNDSTGSRDSGFVSIAANEFAVRATDGFRFRTGDQPDPSVPGTGCNLPAGSGTWDCTSDRQAKTGFASVSAGEVLAQLSRLPIESWIYKTDPARVRHIGPTAQAFKRANV